MANIVSTQSVILQHDCSWFENELRGEEDGSVNSACQANTRTGVQILRSYIIVSTSGTPVLQNVETGIPRAHWPASLANQQASCSVRDPVSTRKARLMRWLSR